MFLENNTCLFFPPILPDARNILDFFPRAYIKGRRKILPPFLVVDVDEKSLYIAVALP
jgi:hypothetical protein